MDILIGQGEGYTVKQILGGLLTNFNLASFVSLFRGEGVLFDGAF